MNSQYIKENVEDFENLKGYTEYLAENINKLINYVDYMGEHVNTSAEYISYLEFQLKSITNLDIDYDQFRSMSKEEKQERISAFIRINKIKKFMQEDENE